MDNIVQPTPVSQAPPTLVPSITAISTSVPPATAPPPAPAAPEGAGSNNGLKAFLIEAGIIAVLAVILLFVLSYFKIINILSLMPSAPKEKVQIVSQSKPIAKVTVQPTVSPIGPYPSSLMQYLSDKKALRSAYTVVDIEGTIDSLDFDGGVSKFGNVPYKVSIDLQIGTIDNKEPIYYAKEQLDKIKVFDKNNKQIQLEDLRIGDKISVKETTSLLIPSYPENLMESVITKL